MEINIKKVTKENFKNCPRHFFNFLLYFMLHIDWNFVKNNCMKCIDHGENCQSPISFETFKQEFGKKIK